MAHQQSWSYMRYYSLNPPDFIDPIDLVSMPYVAKFRNYGKNQKRIFMMKANCNIHLILLEFVFKREKRVKMQRKRELNMHDWGVTWSGDFRQMS